MKAMKVRIEYNLDAYQIREILFYALALEQESKRITKKLITKELKSFCSMYGHSMWDDISYYWNQCREENKELQNKINIAVLNYLKQ